jgi:putative ABC transport system ATP-binding protein
MALIELKNTTRMYTMGARTLYALRDVSVQIERGEFVAVVGPSGSGKSTLLNLVGGIDQPTAGEVWVDGARIDTLDENSLAIFRRNHIGIVFQFFQLLPTLTALENVSLPMELRGDARKFRRRRAEEMLARVGLGARLTQLPSELSGGEQQRVAIARALVNDPPILLADEPTGNLDSGNAEGIIQLLRELAEAGKTILLITHEANLARAAHRTILMRDGEIVTRSLPFAVDAVGIKR